MRTEPIAGRYELVEPLDTGGMGQVWRGYDGVLDREVAVKLVRPDVVTSASAAEEFTKRFQREARITARIRHHGVPQVYDAVLDTACDRLYLVMELVHGTTLRTFIDPTRPLPVVWAAAVAAQICTVLSHAHAIPVVHRDLKPDNVLVCPDGSVKVLDFGIAAILRTDVTRLTSTGGIIGSSHYMPPEQIQGAQIAPYSDLYALGCLLYEMLTGHHVFDAPTDFLLMQQHLSEPPTPLIDLRSDVPVPIADLVLELLAKTPEQRPDDAYAVYERLLPYLPLPGAGPPDVAWSPTPVPDPTRIYRYPNGPRPRDAGSTAFDPFPSTSTPVSTSAPVALNTALRDDITAALALSDELVNQERFAQAADVLQQMLTFATDAFGAESKKILVWRRKRAAILLVGGDYRQALLEFDTLAGIYARTAGPSSSEALGCAQEAAHCKAELGRTAEALEEFQKVLTRARQIAGDVSPTVLDLRRSIGLLLLAEGNVKDAQAQLLALYEDMCLTNGADDEDAQDLAIILARIRASSQK